MSLSKILGNLNKTVKQLEQFTAENDRVVAELATNLDAARADQERANRVTAKLKALLS